MSILIPPEIAEVIQNHITFLKDKHHIYNKVVREDVFEVLQSQCTVLYYDLQDTIEGCHIFKPVNGQIDQQFVFINTNKNVQEQVWTAAHELGHVWKIDQYIYRNVEGCSAKNYGTELLVGRFAAEFLMPESIFREEVSKKLRQFSYKDSQMQEDMMMELIAYLMNFFCTPYKSIVRRFIELGYVKETSLNHYMKFENCDTLNQVIAENQYSRLGKERSVYAIENFPKDLQIVEDQHLLSEKKINKIRELLRIEKQPPGNEQLEFEGNSRKTHEPSGH